MTTTIGIDEQIHIFKTIVRDDPVNEAILATLEHYKRIMSAEMLEPVAWLYSERGGKPFASLNSPSSFDKNELSENEVSVTPLYGPDLLDYALRMESAYKTAHAQAMENGEKYHGAMRQLADANTGHLAATDPKFYEGSLLQRLDDLAHEITGDEGDDDSLTVLRRWAQSVKELQAKHDALAKLISEIKEGMDAFKKDTGNYPFADWLITEVEVAVSAVALRREGE